MDLKLPPQLTAFISKLSYGNRIRPVRDWFFLIGVGLALIVISVGWNLWLLERVETDGIEGSVVPSAAFDAGSIESVRTLFEARAKEEERYRSTYRFVDPSL